MGDLAMGMQPATVEVKAVRIEARPANLKKSRQTGETREVAVRVDSQNLASMNLRAL